MSKPNVFEVEMDIEKLKGHKSPNVYQTQQKSLKHEVGQFDLRIINLLITFRIKMNHLSRGRSQSVYLL